MAYTNQARKRIRQHERRRQRNLPYRTRAARAVRDATDAIFDGDADAAELVREAQSALDQAARRRIIHPNAAARRKSRLVGKLIAARSGS